MAKGFRPFFLLAAAFAVVMLPIWLFTLAGVVGPASYLDMATWHAHEMVFGFTVAVIAGFLLTAVGNWTSRETLIGKPLLVACTLWAIGRVAMAASGWLPRGVPALADLAFLPVLTLALARPLIATGNRRNFVMIAVIATLWAANLLIHLDALGVLPGWSRRGTMLALDVIVLLMIVVAGRIVPMFTKNATGVTSVRGAPTLDKAAAGAMALTTLLDLSVVDGRITGVAAGITGVLVAARARTWGTQHTGRVPLLWILHAGHAWIAIGLLLRAGSAFLPAFVTTSAAIHALTVGAIGCLTLGMMVRVSLGHTGRSLQISRYVTASFVLLTSAAMIRVLVPLVFPAAYRASLFAAGSLWTVAFAVFLVTYAPVLVTARVDGKPG